jgi:predicted permease
MASSPGPLLRVLLFLINAGRWLAPASRRREWRRQWRADLWHESQWLRRHPRGIAGSASLVGRAAGAWRHALWLRQLERISHDLRYGWRLMLRQPGFTAIAVLTIGVGIGANVVVYSWVEAFLRRPIAGAVDPDRLMLLDGMTGTRNSMVISHPDFRDYRARQPEGVAGIIAYTMLAMNMRSGDEPQRVWGQLVSGNYFEVLGVRAARGRTFVPEEDSTPNGSAVAVISHALWERRFGADPNIIGRTIALNGHAFTVIGVSAPGFRGTEPFLGLDIWVPLAMQPTLMSVDRLSARRAAWLQTMVRLEPGVDPDHVQPRFDQVARDLAATYSENQGRGVRLYRLHEAPGRAGAVVLPGMTVMMGLAGVVLLIACANVASLLLARAVGRQRETAVRLALGAGRRRVLQQLVTEGALVAAAGGIAGVAIAYATKPLMHALVPPLPIPVVLDPPIDGAVMVFAIALTAISALAFGLAPALHASGASVVQALKAAAPSISTSRNPARLRQALVVAQLSASIVLLVSASLFMRALQHAYTIDPGFSTRAGLAATIDLTPGGYDAPRGRAFFTDLLARVREVRGVDAASLTTRLPLIYWSHENLTIAVDGYTPAPNEEINVDSSRVGTDYLKAMGIALLAGREFSDRDVAGAPLVGIINATLARRYFGGRNPLGGVVRAGGRAIEVVGVAGDGKYTWITEESRPFLYLPLQQWYRPNVELIVRTHGDPTAVVSAVQQRVRTLDANMALFDVRTIADHLRVATLLQVQITHVLGAFGALALLLATVGLYGVIATTVVQRTSEIGMRIALGATRARIVTLVLGQGLRLALVGIALGVAGAFGVATLLESMLVGVTPTDSVSFAATVAVLIAVALAAAYLPARRAAGIDAIQALRQE